MYKKQIYRQITHIKLSILGEVEKFVKGGIRFMQIIYLDRFISFVIIFFHDCEQPVFVFLFLFQVSWTAEKEDTKELWGKRSLCTYIIISVDVM